MAEGVSEQRALAKEEKSPGKSRCCSKKTGAGQNDPRVVVLEQKDAPEGFHRQDSRGAPGRERSTTASSNKVNRAP